MTKRFYVSVAAFFVITMAVAYSWHMLLFHDTNEAMAAFTRDEPVIPFGMIAIVLQAIVFAYLFPGLTVYSVIVFATAAKFAIEPVLSFFLYGTAFQFIQFLLIGLALGWIYRTRDGPAR